MKLNQFVAELTERGVKLWAEGDQLRVRAAKGVLTPELRDELALHKAELVKLLHNSNSNANQRDIDLPLVRVERDCDLPLSFAQARMWFLSQLEPNNPFYNEPQALRLHGSLNLVALEKSFNKIIARHEILRTNFVEVDGQPVQVIAQGLTLSVPVVDLRDIPESEREISLQRLAIAEAQQPFDLASSPLIRTCVLKLTEVEHILLLTVHHIVWDGWSWGILLRELATIYCAFCNDLSPELPELSIQYADFAVWQRQWLLREVLESQLAYWKQQLSGAPEVLELPTDRVRPKIQTYRGAHHKFVLSKELTLAVVSLSQRPGITLFMTLLAAFQTFIYRYTGQTDICVGTPHANRERPEVESVIGFFVNTLVLRTCLSGNPSFEDVLSTVKDVTLLAHAHQDLPFEKLVEELKLKRDLSYTPLVQVMLVLNVPMPQIQMAGLTVSPLPIETATAKFDLTLSFENTASGLIGDWEYNTDLFDASTIARMASHFQTLLEGIVANPTQRVSQLPLLTERERHQLLVEWNNTTKEYPEDKCIHQLFEEQVERSPDAIAVVFEEEQLTYLELNQRANKIAHHLKTLGVGPEVLVGICVERSLLMVTGLLGILKAGGAYVPLDPAYPTDRLAFMLNDSQTRVLLTQQCLVEKLPLHEAHIICLDTNWETISEENPVISGFPENLAYVIYTSGSTGKPKGVQISHRAVVNFLKSMQELLGLTNSDILLAITTISFDIAALELYLPLIVGARVVLVSREVAQDGRQLSSFFAASSATVIQATPATWRMTIAAGWQGSPKLKILCGGEALPRDLADQLLEKSAGVWNVYGPTETTIWSTLYKVEASQLSHAFVPIGRAIANTQLYILDSYLQPVPIGVLGELYIGGAGVARGYLNRPDLTASKFIPNPWSNEPGSRLYKTGDKARYLPDGNIEFLGRLDNQVKIRGFRIELGEIEAAIAQYPGVRETVVVAREDVPDRKYLAAYIVPSHEGAICASPYGEASPTQQRNALASSELRGFLKEKLPDYMIPSTFVMLSALPLTPNGKVDRRALPKPDTAHQELAAAFVPPRDTVEQQLQRIWAEVLQLPSVGVGDNFFELGGHSLLAVLLMARIEQCFGKNLPLATLFSSSTIEQLAIRLRCETDSLPWSGLVAIQSGGDKRPFFCVPGVGGNVIYLYELARHLGLSQPFYGLQALGLDGESEPFNRVEDIAAYYIEAIQTVQPSGPYLLGGHSFGGVVAFEMATQLQKQGHEVALVAIIDAIAPIVGNKPNCSDEEEAANLFDFASYIEYMFSLNLEVSKETLAELTAFQQLHYLKERLIRVNLLPPDAGIKLVRGLVQVYMASLFAHRSYLTSGVLPTRIALFRAQDIDEKEADISALLQVLKEPTLGWKEMSGTVDVHVVPGNHMTMMAIPQVQVLAQQLQVAIDAMLI